MSKLNWGNDSTDFRSWLSLDNEPNPQ